MKVAQLLNDLRRGVMKPALEERGGSAPELTSGDKSKGAAHHRGGDSGGNRSTKGPHDGGIGSRTVR